MLSELENSLLSLPIGRYPTGWFQAGWSDEVAPAAVKLVHYFGEDIVLWRGESGELYASDAYCLHLGGNLGVGGTVCGEDIQCPWHGWLWNGEGRNTSIPWSVQKCKENLRIRTWAVQEQYGRILIWHDALGRDPLWDPQVVEEFEEGDRYFPMTPDVRVMHRLKAHPQMVMENGADIYHVVYIHGSGAPPEMLKFELEGHRFSAELRMTYGAGKERTWLTPDGATGGLVTYDMTGISQACVRWPKELLGGLILIGSVTPIDTTHSDYYVAMTVPREPGDISEGITGAARRLIDHQFKIIEQDFFTWENMKVLHRANFAPEEGKYYAAFRRWSWQFYPDAGDVAGNDDDRG